jgi:uncharacterized protein YkwD
MRFLCAILFLIVSGFGYTQKLEVLNIKLTEQEKELAIQLNNYRKSLGLDAVPVSISLTYVAQSHAMDLMENYTINEQCNQHSWSEHGRWTPCCYTADHAQAACMWNKPRELTGYPGNGFEIAFYTSRKYNSVSEQAADALFNWKDSPAHNSVICNRNIWSKMNWKAMGIGVCGQYTVAWFGVETDPAGYISK